MPQSLIITNEHSSVLFTDPGGQNLQIHIWFLGKNNEIIDKIDQ